MVDTELPYTEELLARAAETLAAYRREHGQGIDMRKLAGRLTANRVYLVDATRQRSLVDETVYQGALFRGANWRALAEAREPVPMILFCPVCGERHIDQPDPANEWTNPPHRSHLCAACGHIWRPADICTVGVETIQTRGRLDGQTAQRAAPMHHDQPGSADAARKVA